MLEVKKSLLPKAGKGLFTTHEIKKGDTVCEYEGERITWAEAERRNEEDDKSGYVFYITKKNCIDAFDFTETFGRYANDAAGLGRVKGLRNNAVYEIRKNKVYIVATRKIKAGSEVFVSYGKQYWKVMKEELERVEKESKKKKKKDKNKKDKKSKKNKAAGKEKKGSDTPGKPERKKAA
jgi:SET domain-containing protein